MIGLKVGCGKLYQFEWQRNRAEPVFSTIQYGRMNLLIVMAMIVTTNHGNIATPENLVNMKVDVKGYFDIVAIHTGIPKYCFNIVYDLTPFDAETFNLYKDIAKYLSYTH